MRTVRIPITLITVPPGSRSGRPETCRRLSSLSGPSRRTTVENGTASSATPRIPWRTVARSSLRRPDSIASSAMSSANCTPRVIAALSDNSARILARSRRQTASPPVSSASSASALRRFNSRCSAQFLVTSVSDRMKLVGAPSEPQTACPRASIHRSSRSARNRRNAQTNRSRSFR